MKNPQLINVIFPWLLSIPLAVAFSFLVSACDSSDPEKEDTPELITKATLNFMPEGGGTVIVATATDPDGEGVQDIVVDGPVDLSANTTYVMSITLINELAEPSDPEYDITGEVEEEGDEHMFFFSWTNDVFSDPTGDGNIDSRNDPVNYSGGSTSLDVDNRPLGLMTTWTSSASATTGSFRVLLKHQPDLKSDISDSGTGETDLDITFTINVN